MKTLTFDDWYAWLDYVRDCKPIHEAYAREQDDITWQGTRTFSEAYERAKVGIDATDYVLTVEHIIQEVMSSYVREDYVPDVTGLFYDIGEAIKGEPECWFRPEPEEQLATRPKCRLLINNCASAGVDAKVLEGRGKTCFALAQALELTGVNCEIWLAYALTGQSDKCQFLIRLKQWGQQPDYAIVRYALGDVSAFRRLAFKAAEQWFNLSAAYPCDASLTPEFDVETLQFQRLMYGEEQWTDERKSLAWVKSECEKFGVQFTI